MIVQRYTFRCDVPGCEVEDQEITPLNRQVPQSLDMWPPKPIPPPGWRLVDEHIVCPAHTIAIDGIPTQFGTFAGLLERAP